jgi:FixJ family two-component response regulator
VVCVTGTSVSSEKVREAGCCALLRKPMPNQDLIRTVRRCIENKGREDTNGQQTVVPEP